MIKWTTKSVLYFFMFMLSKCHIFPVSKTSKFLFPVISQLMKTVSKEQYLLVLQRGSTCDFSEVTPLSQASETLILFYFLYKQYILKRFLQGKGSQQPKPLKSLSEMRVLKICKCSPEFFIILLTWAWMRYFSSSFSDLCISGHMVIFLSWLVFDKFWACVFIPGWG